MRFLLIGTSVTRGHFTLLATDLGSCSKVDGTCVFDVFHKDGVSSDTTSYDQISRAAEKLYGSCVARGDQRTQGGWIRDLGKYKRVVTHILRYQHTSVWGHYVILIRCGVPVEFHLLKDVYDYKIDSLTVQS